MKKLGMIILLANLYCLGAHALEVTVVVLSTPLFKEPDKKALIAQWVRKGDKLYIHNNDANLLLEDEGEFLRTVTKIGETAYVLKSHVKGIFGDERESEEGDKRAEHDETDYRLSEPLPPNHPFINKDEYRSLLSFGFGPVRKANYLYPTNIISEEFDTRRGLNIMLMKKVSFDPYDRFYYGINLQGYLGHNAFVLQNGASYDEDHMLFSAGPYFFYDAFRTYHFTITFAGGLTLNLHRAEITGRLAGADEERVFQSYNLTPRLGSHIAFTKIIPEGDFIIGAELQAQLPYQLNAVDGPTDSGLWNRENDVYQYPIGAQFTIYLGLQTYQF